MDALFQRWPALAELPYLPLAELPTKVERLDVTSERTGAEVWVKRDDLTHSLYGGNKVRKLAFLLARAQHKGADTVITTGAAGSHHVFATALFARRVGLDVDAVLLPQVRTAHVEQQLAAILSTGARVHPVTRLSLVEPELARLKLTLRLLGRRPFVIPAGGSSATGALGYVQAGLELAGQIENGECPDPDLVFVAAGTCGTVAGLALGLAAAGMRVPVVGVRVTGRSFANRDRIARLVRRASGIIRHLEPAFPDVTRVALRSIDLDSGQLGGGYGQPTPQGEDAAELAAEDGLTLDPTYTAKTFASLLARARRRKRDDKLLYIHTLSSAPLAPFVAEAPPLLSALTKRLLLRA